MIVTALVCITGVSLVQADGLPGEYILSDQWRTFSKYHSPLSNPAFMMERLYSSIRGVVSLSTDNASKLWEAGVVMPLGFYNTVGFTVVGENGRTIQNWSFDDTLGSASNNNYLFTLSYATNPIGRLNAGVNINVAYCGNFGESPSYNMGADLGFSYRLLLHPILGFHLVGLNIQNPFSFLSTGNNTAYTSNTRAYYHTELLGNKIELDIQCDVTDFLTKAEAFATGSKFVEWNVFMQGGVWVLPFVALRGFTSVGHTKKVELWGAACELNVPQVNGGRDFSVLYQFRNELRSELQGTHSLYFRADVGPSREEVHSKRIGRTISLNASELYNRAMKHYYQGQYWNAYLLYMRLLSEFPDFYKNDLVTYYAGSSLEEMDMREESVKMYQTVKTEYALSAAAHMSDLGMMRVFYRQGSYDQVASQYAELNKPGAPDSLLAHANYIMGETELAQGEYRKALQYFSIVPESHPAYVFAQHSSATAHAHLNSGMHMVAASLENCVSAEVKDPAGKEIVNRSLVMLGYIFYEDNALSKAVSALRMVPSQSNYYEDALLGLGWTAIKARQWKDCIDAGQKLSQISGRFIMQGEGALLQAYGNMLQKQYEQARILLEPIIERLRKHQTLSDDSLAAERMRYESDRIQYAFFAENVTNVARRGTQVKQHILDSLHAVQIKSKQKIDKYLLFRDEAKRTVFFERNINMLREDLEYTLATIQKILSTTDIMKVQEKMIHKDKAISSEIEKLKEEMEKMDKN